MTDGQIDKQFAKVNPKQDKMQLLEYYVYCKMLKFREKISEDDDNFQLQDAAAIKLFTDPFQDERLFDLEIVNGCESKLADQKRRTKLKMITGSYEQDILKLIESDILEETVKFAPAAVNNIVRQVMNRQKNLSPMARLVLKFQIYMMLITDKDVLNVLHLACIIGSRLIPFLIEQAKKLGIIDQLLLQQDQQGRTPLFRLCQQGYLKRGKCCHNPKEHNLRHTYIKILVKNPHYQEALQDEFELKNHENENGRQSTLEQERAQLEEQKYKKEYLSYWFDQIPQIQYQPLHWLAFWNDYQSIDFLLGIIMDSSFEQQIKFLFLPDLDGYTALDFAGMHQSFESLLVFIQFFKQHFHFMEKIFSVDKYGNQITSFNASSEEDDSNVVNGNNDDDNNYPWIITRVKSAELSKTQKLFARTFYWAAFIGDIEYCKLFLKKLGISPFMKLFQNKNLVSASIIGCQYKVLELLVEDSKIDKKSFTNLVTQKYILRNKSQAAYFVKSRANKDNAGNNSCHLAFEMVRNNYRYKFLDLLIEEEVGDINKPNVLGLLPHQFEHQQPIANMPSYILSNMPTTMQELQEADYVIVCPEDKKKFILEQLEDLNLYVPSDPQRNLVHQYPFQEDAFDLNKIMEFQYMHNFFETRQLCALAITIPQQKLDEVADELGIEASLTESQFTKFVKTPFKKDLAHKFYAFSATESQKIIVDGILGKEIDFQELIDNGIILDHFPLHKRKSISKMQTNFYCKYSHLKQGFLFGTWQKYMQSINMIKYYYGEDYAFEYAFLIHYQAWLQVPTIIGILIFIYQVFKFFEHYDLQLAIDTPYNALFGLFVTFWATCFVESWKRKQRYIQYLWSCEDSKLNKVDERSEQFKYYNYYNPEINQVEKLRKIMPRKLKWAYNLIAIVMVITIITMMSIHRQLIQENKFDKDQQSNEAQALNQDEVAQRKNKELLINVTFSIFILLVGALYKIFAVKQTDDENWRYQKQYNNQLINRLFRFNLFNFYLPMMLCGFDQSNSHRLYDVFILMLCQMAFKQIASNVIEYLLPILKSKKKLDKHYEDYKKIIKLYDDSQIENKILKRTLSKVQPGDLQPPKQSQPNGNNANIHKPVQIAQEKLNSVQPSNHSQEELNNQNRLLKKADHGQINNELDDSSDNQLSFTQLIKHRQDANYGLGHTIVKDALSFQVYRDLCMMSDPPNIILYYEELVKQFGYIVLFSGIFPLASLLSIISNGIQVRSQIRNLQYLRRFRAQQSYGIGPWLNHLDSLCFLSIIINCYATYFTSNIYEQIFVNQQDSSKDKIQDVKVDGITSIYENSKSELLTSWNAMNFFAFIVMIEHAVLLLKWGLNKVFEDVPYSVQKGERDNEAILKRFSHKHGHEVSSQKCQMADTQKKIRLSKRRMTDILQKRELASSQKFGFLTLQEDSSVSDHSSQQSQKELVQQFKSQIKNGQAEIDQEKTLNDDMTQKKLIKQELAQTGLNFNVTDSQEPLFDASVITGGNNHLLSGELKKQEELRDSTGTFLPPITQRNQRYDYDFNDNKEQ